MKSTYRHTDEPIQKFSSSIQRIKSGLIRPDLPNTAYGGEIKDDTLLFDMVHGSPNQIQNPLFTFMVFVDKGDFDCEKMKSFFVATADVCLPNIIIFLNAGVVIAAELTEGDSPSIDIQNFIQKDEPFVISLRYMAQRSQLWRVITWHSSTTL